LFKRGACCPFAVIRLIFFKKRIKRFSCMVLLFPLLTHAQKLVKVWETDTLFRIPESVLFDPSQKQLYISNIDGAPGEKDGKGSISILKTNGKMVKPAWTTGLNAPKGMAIFKNVLYVADLDAVVGFDAKTGKEVARFPIAGARFLNDLTVDDSGNLYVSDSETGLIHKISNGQATTIIEKRTRPNGVLWYMDQLYFVDAGAFYRKNPDGSIQELANNMERSTDGIVALGNDNFLISSWIGAIYYVKNDGSVKELLNTKAQKLNSADIGYNPKEKMVYVPTFATNRVAAYRLQEE